jgi:hypothetical protein
LYRSHKTLELNQSLKDGKFEISILDSANRFLVEKEKKEVLLDLLILDDNTWVEEARATMSQCKSYD